MRNLIATFVLMLVSACTAFAQTKTSNAFVSAIVDPGNQGLITIRVAPGTNLDPILSYPQKSYIAIRIGDKIFTNNNSGNKVASDPRLGGFLNNGTTQKIGDTIRTTWANRNNCDIIQEVYPVKLRSSGQIVMRWKIRNNETSLPSLVCQNQLLLDFQVGAQNPNDGSPLLTRHGYKDIWQKFSPTDEFDISWFYGAFENRLPNAPTFSTGTAGVGYTSDQYYKLGLTKPSLMVYGDWSYEQDLSALVDFLWGVSSEAPWGQKVIDASLLMQWDSVTVKRGETVELSRTSYGTGEFIECHGQLYGLVFYPRNFEWDGSTYIPDTGTVEFYAINMYSPRPQDPDFGPTSENTLLKLHTGPNLRIIDPDTGRSLGQHSQRQSTQPGDIFPSALATATWKIVADPVFGNGDDRNSWLKFTAMSSLSKGGPVFFNSGDADTCEHPVVIQSAGVDVIRPDASYEVGPSSDTAYSLFVWDSRVDDSGIDSIYIKVDPALPYSISIDPPLVRCSKDTHHVSVIGKIPLGATHIDWKAIDCAGNSIDGGVIIDNFAVEDDQSKEACELLINPATDRSLLRIDLLASQQVSVRIVDVTGKQLSVYNLSLASGVNDVPLITTDLSAGTYYVIAEWNGKQHVKKLQVVK